MIDLNSSAPEVFDNSASPLKTPAKEVLTKKASPVTLGILGVVAFVAIFAVVMSLQKPKQTTNTDVTPTPTVSAEGEGTPYPTSSITTTPQYTDVLEDKTFYLAQNKKTNEVGIFFTSPLYRSYNEATVSEYGTIYHLAYDASSEGALASILFSELRNTIKLGSIPSNLPYNSLNAVKGFEKDSYIISVFDDVNCTYKVGTNSDECLQYTFKLQMEGEAVKSFSKIRTYAFGTQNKTRKTFGVETIVAALSPTQIAVDVNDCHWCGLEDKEPMIYIVNIQSGKESSMGMIGNIKASADGKTFTYQKLKKVPYVCSGAECEYAMQPSYEYVPTGSVLTGQLK